MSKKAVLSDYLWIHKSSISNTDFLQDWVFEIPLLKTAQGQIKQQQISALRETFGKELDIEDITEDDVLTLQNWCQDGDWYGLSRGNIKKVRKLVKKLGIKVKDRRTKNPWGEELSDLKMLVDLRDYQVDTYNQWIDKGHGVLKAAPGFGKTVLMLKAIIDKGQKALVLVNSNPLKSQFIERFRYGAPNADGTGHLALTNCAELEEELGTEIIGTYSSPKKKWVPGKTAAAGQTWPVTVATWQSFNSPRGQAALKELSKEFGLTLCDEVHVFAAPKAGAVVNGFNPRYRMGVSATPQRKDQYDTALYDIVGPVTAVGSRPQLKTTATMIATGVKYQGVKYQRTGEFAYLLNHLYKSKSRTDLIYDWCAHDLRMGRKILVIAERVGWIRDMAKRFNKSGFRASAVTGSTKEHQRKEIIKSMLDDEIDVIVASSVFKAGVDIPCLDTLHLTGPGSNAPQLEQMLGRITRPYEGKQEPLLRYYVDGGHGLIYGCANKTTSALKDLDVNVITVPEGTKPGEHKIADGHATAIAADTAKRKDPLRRAAVQRKVASLEKDQEKRDFESTRYRNRLKGRRG